MASPEPRTDVELLMAWRAGDRAAGDVLTKRYYHSVLRFFELKAQWVAQDLTQKTFLGCVQAVSRLGEGDSFRGYLFGVARNQLLMYLRSAARKKKMMGFGGAQPDTSRPGYSTIVARAQEQRLLLQALVSLPVDTQALLGLFYWEGLTSNELAQAMEIPAPTVRGRLARAREALRVAIGDVDVPTNTKEVVLRDFDTWARSLAVDP